MTDLKPICKEIVDKLGKNLDMKINHLLPITIQKHIPIGENTVRFIESLPLGNNFERVHAFYYPETKFLSLSPNMFYALTLYIESL